MKSFTNKSALDILRSNIEFEREHPDMWTRKCLDQSPSIIEIAVRTTPATITTNKKIT